MYIQSNINGIVYMDDVEYFQRQLNGERAFDEWFDRQMELDDRFMIDNHDDVDDGPVATGDFDDPNCDTTVPF